MDAIVVGGGLAGLATALLLHERGHQVAVLEAKHRFGGRIHSLRRPRDGSYVADLGPTWVWPEYQPTVARWLQRLGIATVAQFEQGEDLIDLGRDVTPRRTRLPRQYGVARPLGGPQAFVDGIVEALPVAALRTGTQVLRIDVDDTGVEIAARGDGEHHLRAATCVIAAPPRIALRTLAWTPPLPLTLRDALARQGTWMAPHAKVVALYDDPFWRERGLSGRIASQVGPLAEVHDHCGPQGSPAALFGFAAWPRSVRARLGARLHDEIAAQLRRCFAPDPPAPRAIHVEDWAVDPLVATDEDLAGGGAHPPPPGTALRAAHQDGRIVFASAETAPVSTGLIDGALAVAEAAAASLDRRLRSGRR